MIQEDTQVGWSELLAPEYRYKILFLGAALWLHAANSMLAATTLPAAVTDIGGLHLINWAFALYLTASVVAGTAMSLFVNKYGLRKTMQGATLLYVLGSAICASAYSMPFLLMGRVLQGVGGGGLVALVYLTQNLFFPNRFLPRVMACMSMVWMISAFCGPLVGGTFATFGLWRGAFFAFILQAGLLLWAIPKLVPSDEDTDSVLARPVPLVQLTFLALAILAIAAAGASYHNVYSPLLVITGLLAMGLFIVLDSRAGVSQMLPEGVTRLNNPTSAGLLMTLCLSISLMSFLVYGPILLMRFHGLSPLAIGFVLMLEAIGWGIAAIIFSGAALKFERRIILAGNAVVLLGLISNTIVLPHGPLWLAIVSVTICNVGFGMMWGYIIRRLVNSVDEANKKRASSIMPVTQQAGFALGAAFAGIIANGMGLSDNSSISELKLIAAWLFAGFIPLVLLGNYFAFVFTRRD